MLDLESLQLFVRCAELGSLSKAAEQSNLALAAVSRRVSMLETHYGVQLLIRTGRGVQPTPAGIALLERASEILRAVGVARIDMSDFGKGLRGVVSLQASTSAITQFLPNDLAAFSRICPDLRLDIREAYTADIISDLHNGRVDVAIVIEGPTVVNLTTLPYRRDRLVVVAKRDFCLARDKAKFSDLLAHDFVLMENNTSISRQLTASAAEVGLPLRVRVRVGGFDAVCRMVEAGFGLGVLPRAAAQNFEASMGLRLIELEDAWAERQMLICTNPTIGASAAAKRLVAHLHEQAAASERQRP